MKKAIELVQEIQNDRKNRQEESNLGWVKTRNKTACFIHTYQEK
jgi:SH3-like domain-containing protein